mgnify:FL=1
MPTPLDGILNILSIADQLLGIYRDQKLVSTGEYKVIAANLARSHENIRRVQEARSRLSDPAYIDKLLADYGIK